tara:strand:- start:1296 stop:1499 length:204 start_codon:yes stop_codon:yes gene_type:complete
LFKLKEKTMARKKIDNKVEKKPKMSIEERLQNLLQSRQQMQEGLVKVQGAIEVLSAMLEEEKDGEEK